MNELAVVQTEAGRQLADDLRLLYRGVPLILGRPEDIIKHVEAEAVAAFVDSLRSRAIDGSVHIAKGRMEYAVEAAWDAATSPVGNPADGIEMHDLAMLAAGICDALAIARKP